MINNRQAGRRRGRGGGGNGQRQGGNPGRPDNGNRIDNRARGNANQLYEKYKNLASDAQRQGDRVNTEYYLQFADHYFRVLNENRSRFEDQSQRRPRDENFVNGFDSEFEGDDEFGDEGEPIRAGDQFGEAPRRESQRREGRRDREGREGGGRNGSGREDHRAGAGGTHADPVEAIEQEPIVAAAPLADEAAPVDAEAAPAEPRRRGRPRRERPAAEEAAPAAIEADRLPPSLSAGGNVEAAAEEEPKPRRRRTRAAAQPTEATPAG